MRKLLVIVLTLVGVLVVALVGLKLWVDGYSKVADVSCGGSRKIRLLTSNFWDPLPDLYYQVYEDGAARMRIGFVGCTENDVDPRDLKYQCLLSSDRAVAAVVAERDPDTVLALFDFRSGASWPYNWNTPWEEHNRQAQAMLGLVQEAHKGRNLSLLRKIQPIGGRRSKEMPNKSVERTAHRHSAQGSLDIRSLVSRTMVSLSAVAHFYRWVREGGEAGLRGLAVRCSPRFTDLFLRQRFGQ